MNKTVIFLLTLPRRHFFVDAFWIYVSRLSCLLYCLVCSSQRVMFSCVFVTFPYERRHEISNNVVCATSKASDQPAHTRSLTRAFASRVNIL